MADLQTKIVAAIKVARPIHWIKNLALFAALVFTGKLFSEIEFTKVFWAFIAFNFATSATYVFNDIIDAAKDRLHPIKKNRPIASGKLPVTLGWLEVFVLTLIALFLGSLLPQVFFLAIISYLLLQAAYSLFLKDIPIIDILVIASGFIIRIYAGAFVIDAHLSVWFLLCVISVALFLASGKRRAELGVVDKPGMTRKSLTHYPRELLNSYVTMFGNAAWMSWALFSFFESPKASMPLWLVLSEISRATTVNKLLMITIPITIYGIMRYESLIFEGRGEAPERVLLTDISLVASVAVWIMLVVWIFYSGFTTGI